MAMAASVLDSLKGVAQSVASKSNSFSWDSKARNFQYVVAGIIVTVLALSDTINTMKCSTTTTSLPAFYFVSAYCREADWYRIIRNDTRIPYEQYVRRFKFVILIPTILTLTVSVLYAALVNSFTIQANTQAFELQNVWKSFVNMLTENEVTDSLILMKIRTRLFAENNLHLETPLDNPSHEVAKDGNLSVNTDTLTRQPDSETEMTDGSSTELLFHSHQSIKQLDTKANLNHMGHKTSLYYHLFLGVCVIINLASLAIINPYFFVFLAEIACNYRNTSLKGYWSLCSVPDYRYSTAALYIVMICHTISVMVSAFSLFYLHVYIPQQISDAGVEISCYTREEEQREKLHEYWVKHGSALFGKLTATSKFLLALVYQNMGRPLCFKLLLALVDIEKDKHAVDVTLLKLVEEIIDMKDVSCLDQDKDEKIRVIREVILNPADIDYARNIIKNKILIKCIRQFLQNPKYQARELLKAQQIHRFTGVQLPKFSSTEKKEFSRLIQNMKESDFASSVDYYRHLSALYDLSKSSQFFAILNTLEIGNVGSLEPAENTIDNGHETVDEIAFDARKAFDASGYCWRSKTVTEYNWIRRSWNVPYAIKLIAIQASHTNAMAAPVHFSFSANLENGDISSWVNVSESFRSYNWLKDEWRVFPLIFTDLNAHLKMPSANCIQMNIFKNEGADYFEIQKIKIYGKAI